MILILIINGLQRIDSPYLPVKSGGILALQQQPIEKSNSAKLGSSILAKKSRIPQKSTRNVSIRISEFKIVGSFTYKRHWFRMRILWRHTTALEDIRNLKSFRNPLLSG